MEKILPVTLKEVMSTDSNSPYWQYMLQRMAETGTLAEIEHFMTQSRKYGRPYVDLTDEEKLS